MVFQKGHKINMGRVRKNKLPYFPDTIKEKYYCQCGCDEEIIIKPFHSWYGIPKYIHGHNLILNNPTKGKERPEHIKKILDRTGKLHSKKSKQKMSESRKDLFRGELNPSWKGGITLLQNKIRNSKEYKLWRIVIFERDNYICQECNSCGVELNAHHIKYLSQIIKEYNISSFEEALRCVELWKVENGITLCEECHKKKPNWLGEM